MPDMPTPVSVTVTEPFERTRTWETASNWTKYTVQPSTYPLAQDPRSSTGIYWAQVATIETEEFYVNRLFAASSSHHEKNLNRKSTHHMSWYGYELTPDKTSKWSGPIVINYEDTAR